MDIGERIKELRTARNLTQKELAEKTKIAIGTLQQYEGGKRKPTAEIIVRLAKALNVSSDQLLNVIPLSKMGLASITGLTEKNSNNNEIELLKKFNELSEESRRELFKHIELLLIKDEFDRIARMEHYYQ